MAIAQIRRSWVGQPRSRVITDYHEFQSANDLWRDLVFVDESGDHGFDGGQPGFPAIRTGVLRVPKSGIRGRSHACVAEVVEAAIGVRALGGFPFFKTVLITNGSGLDQAQVQEGLEHFTKSDEIWVKLDGGTQEFMDKMNRPKVSLEKILSNILTLARRRPVVIQSLFATFNGEEPSYGEIRQYAERLKELKRDGAQIPVVQIYSATRPVSQNDCSHLPLKTLSFIAQTVRNVSGLKAEVF